MLENLIFMVIAMICWIGIIFGVVFIVNGLIIKSKSAKFLGFGILISCGIIYALISWWYYA